MFAIKKILVPVDFGDSSDAAVEYALELAKRFEADVIALHAYEIPGYSYPGAPLVPVIDIQSSLAQSAQGGLDAIAAKMKQRWPKVTTALRCGVPWREIVDAAKQGSIDLVVMGTHGRHGLAHAMVGSVAERVVRASPVPVLTVRGKGH